MKSEMGPVHTMTTLIVPSINIVVRKAAEPVELIRLVKALKKELCREVVVELPQPLKLKITNEIVERLKTLRPKANVTEQRGQWCKEKLKEAKQLALETDASNSTVRHEEAGVVIICELVCLDQAKRAKPNEKEM
ncbi:unnamed protein product [Prunus brigantina]